MSRIAHISAAGGGAGGPQEVDGSKTPSDTTANPTDAVATESFTMVWGPNPNDPGNPSWSRWGVYGIDNGVTAARVPGVAIFGQPELSGGETPQQAGVVTVLANNHDSFHALRVASSDIYRAGSSPIDYRQSDSEVDGNTVDVSGLVTPVVWNGTSLDRVRSASGDNMAATGILAAGNMVFDGTNWDRVRVGTAAGSLIVNNDTAANLQVTTTPDGAATPSQSSVASSATNVTILASNANRRGATVYNDSTQTLYLKLGATASTSSFTVLMAAASYYEVPFNYTGIIDGLWASANGNARVTEITN